MCNVKLTFIGCGDAFGSGGRFQSCILVESGNSPFLIDCGSSSLISIRQNSINPNGIETVLVTNFHGDHFGGLPYFLLDAQLMKKRSRDLAIAGPPGLEKRLTEIMEATFPGSSAMPMRFGLHIEELQPGINTSIGNLRVTAFPAAHLPQDPHIHLRIECGGRVIIYTGDTEWTDALELICADSDLIIAESYFFDKQISYHLDYVTLAQKLGEVGAKRVVLTHMSEQMLAKVRESKFQCARDGMLIEL